MTPLDDVRQLKELVQQLREIDTKFRIFGSDSHRYRLHPTQSEEQLQAFETQHKIHLPEDYRWFLKEVGSSGAGPSYGLESLNQAAEYLDLSQPFPLTKDWEFYTYEEIESFLVNDEFPGILQLCHHGCANYSNLVVNGPAHGTIWNSGDNYFDNTNLSFAAWYRDWVEKELKLLRNEPLVDQIKLGMSKTEVIELTGSDWKEREVAKGIPFLDGHILFESLNFRVQLVLSEERNVIQIRRF